MTTPTSKTRFHLTRLEERDVPAMFGTPWPDAENLTIGFAADGTDIDGQSSSLVSSVNGSAGSGWQETVLRAYQTWAVHGNVNLGLVADDGAAFGSERSPQGGDGRADIRLGGVALGNTEIAVSAPFDVYANWSGDVIFNTEFTFSDGGAGGTVDLFTVALHEAGHTLGLGNNPDPTSAMFTRYEHLVTGLSEADVANLQALYGVRGADRFDAAGDNGSRADASELSYAADTVDFAAADPTEGNKPFTAVGDLQTVGDVDWYEVKLPNGQSELKVSLRTSGISLLTAEVGVYDAAGNKLTSAQRADPLNGDIELTATGLSGNSRYYVKVESGRSDVFGVGSYRLAVGSGAGVAVDPPEYTGDVHEPGSNRNDTQDKAKALDKVGRTGKAWDYVTKSKLTVGDTDWFSVTAPADQEVSTLVVAGWAYGDTALDPEVEIYTAAGSPVSGVVTLDDDGYSKVLHLDGVTAGETYYVKVWSGYAGESGRYMLGADFRTEGVVKDVFALGTISPSDRTDVQTIYSAEAQLARFELMNFTQVQGILDMFIKIRDPEGRVIFSATSGLLWEDPVFEVLLERGVYTVEFSYGIFRSGEVRYALVGNVITDPIGPVGDDPIDAPQVPPPPPPPPGEEDPMPVWVDPPEADDDTSWFSLALRVRLLWG